MLRHDFRTINSRFGSMRARKRETLPFLSCRFQGALAPLLVTSSIIPDLNSTASLARNLHRCVKITGALRHRNSHAVRPIFCRFRSQTGFLQSIEQPGICTTPVTCVTSPIRSPIRAMAATDKTGLNLFSRKGFQGSASGCSELIPAR